MTDRPNLTPVYDLALRYSRAFERASPYPVYTWINEGCDIQKDIVPTLERIMSYKPGITTFGYFTNAILEARDRRLAKEKYQAEQDAKQRFTGGQEDHAKAKRLAWLRERVPSQFIQYKDWMEKYEQQHGKVAL